jgi:hypothetical protein
MKAARDLRNGRADQETGAWRTTVSERWHAVRRLPMGLVGDLTVTSEGLVQEIVDIR